VITCFRHPYRKPCGADCPMFVPALNSCLEVLKLKQDLNILSQKEKQELTSIRINGSKG